MADTGEQLGNAEQARFWNEEGGASWVELQDRMDTQLAPIGDAALELADARPGEHVLDIGCGCGATTLALANAVGREGAVIGFDISTPMTDLARQRANALGLTWAHFRVGDAQVAKLASAHFDLLFSRFGVMFFADPVAAFANLRAAAKAGGRLAFVCWQKPALNEWASIAGKALAAVLAPQAPVDPLAPGPFAFADPGRTQQILADAGWTDVGVDPFELETALGGTTDFDEAVDLSLRIGPASRAIGAFPEQRGPARAAVAEALRPHYREGEGLRLKTACWLVSARRAD